MTTNNHPAQGPVSLDRLHQIREHLQHDTQYSNGGNRAYILADVLKVIDVAITSFGAEPVAWMIIDIDTGEKIIRPDRSYFEGPCQPLYAAPPAPEVPETLPCPVHLEPGLKFGKGVRTQCVLDALRRRADYYAELEAMTPEQRAEHDAVIADFKAMLGNGSRGDMVYNDPQHAIQTAPTLDTDGESAFPQRAMLQAGNSPATPDGWQLVPKEPTEAMNKAGWAAMNEHDAINPTYRAMLAAAPQQDVRLALEIGMSRYAGAMQKLVDSGD
ncbi:hypothetical protein [Citrobacter freundii]|uniref:hypothetical protein n=1 Tax=Citrobacter freundii TaxID=546 RepID=UPI002B27760E|nr:hypothetical protein [Citrobacter freundii]MEA8858640.1 hypothetical protein [Citrobacter freundii]